jgi:lysophospholipase L1-like esterase
MKILCAGDSLTRAQVSADYIKILERRMPNATFLRAGVNLELSSGLRARLDSLVAYKADAISVLTGTNNVRYALSESDAERLRRRWSITEPQTLGTYREDLRTIALRLRNTGARVAFLSLPVVGEVLGSEPLRKAAEFSNVVQEVAAEQGISYLPLHERMVAFLRAQPAVPKTLFRPGIYLSATAAVQNLIFRRSFDAISRSRGLQLTTDTLHLNTQGAGMIAELITGWLGEPMSRAGS